jgi:5-methyltetrahydrofolate--homocysteine methyltransferase
MDGATGTQLQAMGLPAGASGEAWNLDNPNAVTRHYQAYIDAGSDAILTNTFCGSRPMLEKSGNGNRTLQINEAAARLARTAAGDTVLVLGSIGPTGLLMDPYGPLLYDQAVAYFAEQATALAAGGADGIHVETMSDLSEARAAIEGARSVTDLPVTATMSFDTNGHTMMGVKPEDAAREFLSLGVLAVGANCGRTLDENLAAVAAMRSAFPDAALIAKPNAGLPRVEDGAEIVYDVTPQVMAEYAARFADLNVKMMGSCCGSGPGHIAAIREVLRG